MNTVRVALFLILLLTKMRYSLFLMVVNYVKAHQHSAQQQINVTEINTQLSQGRFSLAATSSSGLVFFGGGFTSFTSVSNLVDIYNVTSGNWTTATLSVPRAIFAATSAANLVFFAGGTNSTTGDFVYNIIDIYSITNGSWTNATLSTPRHGLAAASVGNFVLFGGGFDFNNPSNVVDIFNLSNNAWTTTTLSQARVFLAATSVMNRYALFAGGWSASGTSNVVDIFDAQIETWNTSSLSQPRGLLAAASLNNLAFFGGGNETTQSLNTVDIFNATSHTWSNATLSQARYLLAAAAISDIVAFGGGTTNGLALSALVDMYNGTDNIWFTVTLSQPSAYLAATSSTNKIFFGGGLGNTEFSDVVDIFDFATSSQYSPAFTPSLTFSSFLSTPSVVKTPLSLSSISLFAVPITKSNESFFNTSSLTSNALSRGAIAGLVIGIIVVLVAAAIVVMVFFFKRKRQRKQSIHSEMTKTQETKNISNENKNILCETGVPYHRTTQIAFNELVVERDIGDGSYGKVYLGRWNHAPVALKFCKKRDTVRALLAEIRVMIQLPPHPNVVQLFGISLDGPNIILIMEYCAGGSLDHLLYNNCNDQKLTNERKNELVLGIARGIFHLHKHNIVHRDLAARNILLTSTGEPKISDFGMSRILEKAEEGNTKMDMGPVYWMAPESIATRNYSKKTDVWMFGIVVYEIVAQCEPHKNKNVLEVAVAIRDHGLTPTIPDDCPSLLREVMTMCWKKDPNERPTFETVFNMLVNATNVGVG